MEHIHGIDVKWMSHGSSKDKGAKSAPRRRNTIQSQSTSPPQSASPPASPRSSCSPSTGPPPTLPSVPISPPVAIPKLQRRSSWFSNISSKFSSSPGSSPPQATNTAPKQAELSVPRANPAKNAVLQHAAKSDGDRPYTPAPPKSSPQAGFFHVLRRLSTSSGNSNPPVKGNHGLVERKILNVDHHRERCRLAELSQTKLRRVSFCVDVEIAPMPKYVDQDAATKKLASNPIQLRKLTEKAEGEALKNAKALLSDDTKGPAATATATATAMTTATATATATANAAANTPVATPAPAPTSAPVPVPAVPITTSEAKSQDTSSSSSPPTSCDASRKKEKKKKSEEERKARKERKRRLAEANGTIPMEIHLDSDDSDAPPTTKVSAGTVTTARTQLTPTTNPVRIYRRCCQLRETPILKKITEQLSSTTSFSSETGIVEKLDLTGYWMQLADLTTLGDFLAVVPIREVILENCGLNDEGLRVILAGLLAARKPQKRHIHVHHHHHHTFHMGVHQGQTVPVTASAPDGTAQQGGFVERLVLKNNKISAEGWRYLCLFVYMCRSLRVLDMSGVLVPQSAAPAAQPTPTTVTTPAPLPGSPSVSELLAKAIGERLGGSTLELVNIGETGLKADQLGPLIDGLIKCGTRRLGLAHNDLDDACIKHVARYIASNQCEGLDLGGNDLRDRIELLTDAVGGAESLWALSLADSNLKPSSLCKLLPQLSKLHNFRFLDLSHNHDLFQSDPSATGILRRCLPKLDSLKRLHLEDVGMTAEQAIAIAEILPELKELAHVSFLGNPELSKLADARTEETQEQACAFYASLLAATRVSTTIVAIDMDSPTPESSEIVRAMAKQALAYCLRNVERVTSGNITTVDGDVLAFQKPLAPLHTDASSATSKTTTLDSEPEYPDVIQHLVGHDASALDEGSDVEAAPDDNYVIGGTGVAQALECCLKNRGSDSNRHSGEFSREDDDATAPETVRKLPVPGKAKDMSKHLLLSARKIRLRLQPALQKAQSRSDEDTQAYHRLLFLDKTLDGIIKRFEEEFPETRISTDSGVSMSTQPAAEVPRPHIDSLDLANDAEAEAAAALLSDGEDDTDIRPSALSRSSSMMSISSRLTNEEGRVFRVGHRFRSGWFRHYNMIAGVEEIQNDPTQSHVLKELIHELDNEELNKMLAEKGTIRLFKEDRETILQALRASDPAYWDRFLESQYKARANTELGSDGQEEPPRLKLQGTMPEQAIEDDAVSDTS